VQLALRHKHNLNYAFFEKVFALTFGKCLRCNKRKSGESRWLASVMTEKKMLCRIYITSWSFFSYQGLRVEPQKEQPFCWKYGVI